MKKTYRSILSIGLLSVLVVSLVFMLTGCGFFNDRPTAKITTDPSPTNGTVELSTGEDVEFDGSGSSDSDGTIASYDWSLGADFTRGSNVDEGDSVQTGSYSTKGDRTVKLTVTDDQGSTDIEEVEVSVS